MKRHVCPKCHSQMDIQMNDPLGQIWKCDGCKITVEIDFRDGREEGKYESGHTFYKLGG